MVVKYVYRISMRYAALRPLTFSAVVKYVYRISI